MVRGKQLRQRLDVFDSSAGTEKHAFGHPTPEPPPESSDEEVLFWYPPVLRLQRQVGILNVNSHHDACSSLSFVFQGSRGMTHYSRPVLCFKYSCA